MMYAYKKSVKLAGVLILFQLITATISYSVILEPLLFGSKDFLIGITSNPSLVRSAMLLDFLTGAAWFGASVLLFPVLKKYSEPIALWFMGIRLGEFITLILTGILLLTLLYIGEKYVEAGTSKSSYLLSLGEVIRYARGSTQNLGLLAYSTGTALFYYLMFRTRLIPRFLSVLGFLGVAGLLTEILLSMFGYSTASFMYWIMIPMGLSEILLGIWLIIKGFNQTKMLSNINQSI